MLLNFPQVGFDLGRDAGCRAAAKVGFHFEAVEGWRIVACSDHDAADELSASDFERNVRRRIRTIHQQHLEAVGCHNLCGDRRKFL